MTTTNHDSHKQYDQLGEIYPTMLNELNYCTFGISLSRFHCCGYHGHGLWPSIMVSAQHSTCKSLIQSKICLPQHALVATNSSFFLHKCRQYIIYSITTGSCTVTNIRQVTVIAKTNAKIRLSVRTVEPCNLELTANNCSCLILNTVLFLQLSQNKQFTRFYGDNSALQIHDSLAISMTLI